MQVFITERNDGRGAQAAKVNPSSSIVESVRQALKSAGAKPIVLFDLKVMRQGERRVRDVQIRDGMSFEDAHIKKEDTLIVIRRAPTEAEQEQLIKVKNVYISFTCKPSESDEVLKSFRCQMSDFKREKEAQTRGGSYGTVYPALFKKTGERVAVKEILPNWTNRGEKEMAELRKRFDREVIIMATMKHPAIMNIVGYVPFEYSGVNRPALIMKYMPKNVQDMVNLELRGLAGDWDLSAKHIVLYGVAAGMAFLHMNRIMHRDLKPDNVLLDDENYPHITDFGLSKFVPTGHTNEQSIWLGTLPYMAPEIQLDPEGRYTEKVDVYAFGVMMYTVLAGVNPFPKLKNEQMYRHFQRLERGDRPQLDMVPEKYRPLIEACWATAAESRPTFNTIVKELGRETYLLDVDVEKFKDYQAKVAPEKFVPPTKRGVSFESQIRRSSRVGIRSSMVALEQSADRGHADAMYRLAEKYRDGDNVDKDEKKAFHWFERAFQSGYTKAAADLGLCYEKGVGVSSNIGKAIEYYKIGISHDVLEAMYRLGMCYYYGSGVTRNEIEAVALFKMAANERNRYGDAENMYGECLEIGRGCRKDEKQALQYYSRSNSHGSTIGMYNFADMLFHGKPFEQDVAKACDLFWLVAKRGESLAYYTLYEIYSRGYENVSKDMELARRAAYEGVQAGNMRAMIAYSKLIDDGYGMFEETKADAEQLRARALSRQFSSEQNNFGVALSHGKGCFRDEQQAFYYFKVASENGSAVAWHNLGHYYRLGTVVEKNDAEAARCYRRAMDMGCVEASVDLANVLIRQGKLGEAFMIAKKGAEKDDVAVYTVLGHMYMKGQGCDKSQAKGFELYQQAAKANVPEGLYKAGCCLMKGKGTSRDYPQARVLLQRAAEQGSDDLAAKAKKKLDNLPK